jgi:RES domain-containing protein
MLLIGAEIPDALPIETLGLATLPPDWSAALSPISTKDVGTAWLKSKRTAVLAVPSVLVPHERNYLLNPKHPDFALIKFRDTQPFIFDPRLK